ncbi:carboxymuconolactone decarboxylase family protein [Aliamphritea ceti]|uniref:carboxymuconolactone decarboxylase family protein n=1 Tax=Aliamphritea ceti TaxID=1524258 RepID=UPI0021C269F0|nr:carboxymuconolactone decarboxylase family protein [Aliamphritea ceti]
MSDLTTLLNTIPEIQDQLTLFTDAASATAALSSENRDWVLWASLHAMRDKPLIEWAKKQYPEPLEAVKRGVLIASSRMAVTNPYFMASNIQPLQAGGSLEDLSMRPFSELQVQNTCGYHYACIAISVVNGGFVCYNSHLHSLRQEGESDTAIDQALRMVASLSSIRQSIFNADWLI